MLKNDRFLRALLREPVDRTPCWMMRQAGRYLPEYRATRSQAGSFMALCQNPQLACEVTLQPLRRFAFDAAILFSDILTIPDAMGLGLSFAEGEGPQFAKPIQTRADIARLGALDPHAELRYVIDAVSLIRQELDGSVPLIGFSGSPWTLATYMVEGKSSKEFAKIKGLLYSDPQALTQLLDILSQSSIHYLNAQIAAGAQAVMLFDTWGGVLSPEHYRQFSLLPMQKIIDQLTRHAQGRRVPVILFTKNGGAWLPDMAATGADALGIDWMTDLSAARRSVGHQVALQGNLDPAVLYAPPQVIAEEVGKVLAAFGQHDAQSGHIFNLGHGIHPGIQPDHVAAMVDAIHALSPAWHLHS